MLPYIRIWVFQIFLSLLLCKISIYKKEGEYKKEKEDEKEEEGEEYLKWEWKTKTEQDQGDQSLATQLSTNHQIKTIILLKEGVFTRLKSSDSSPITKIWAFRRPLKILAL